MKWHRTGILGFNVYVVFCKRLDRSEWIPFPNRREADKYGARMRKEGYRIKKRICKIPVNLIIPGKDWGNVDATVVEQLRYFIEQSYPHCVGIDKSS